MKISRKSGQKSVHFRHFSQFSSFWPFCQNSSLSAGQVLEKCRKWQFWEGPKSRDFLKNSDFQWFSGYCTFRTFQWDLDRGLGHCETVKRVSKSGGFWQFQQKPLGLDRGLDTSVHPCPLDGPKSGKMVISWKFTKKCRKSVNFGVFFLPKSGQIRPKLGQMRPSGDTVGNAVGMEARTRTTGGYQGTHHPATPLPPGTPPCPHVSTLVSPGPLRRSEGFTRLLSDTVARL